MTSTQSLLRKADLTIQDLRDNGGELLPEQAATFIRKLIKNPKLIRQARVVEMTSPQRRINKIGFASRILRKATSAVALTEAQRSKPTTEQIELITKEQIAEVRIPYDVMEDNIERATTAHNEGSNTGPGALRQTLIELIAERAATDTEELLLLASTGYTNGSDQDDEDFLSQLDGWIARSEDEGNVVDINGAMITKNVFKQGKMALPVQYQRNLPAMRHFISVNQETEYRDTIADRGTGLGDNVIQGMAPVYAYGVPIEALDWMPEDKGLFCNPLNLIFGIQRQVSMEFDKDITSRVYIIVVTMRIDCQIEESEAVSVYNNIGSA